MTRRDASHDFMTRNHAATQAFAYQLAEVWLDLHPNASAEQLVDFLRQEALRAEAAAAEVAVARDGVTMEQAVADLAYMHEYRDLMRKELSTR